MIGSSATANAFDARVSVLAEGESLFFVIGRDGPPDTIIRAAGGHVVTRLPDPRRVIAIAPLDAYASLRRHPGLELAGPVSIDAERFGRFAQLIRLEEPGAP